MNHWGASKGVFGGRPIYAWSHFGTGPITLGPSFITSTAWPAANLAIFAPIVVEIAITLAQFFVLNGATVSGNVDIGLYAIDGTKLVSAGSTAQAGTSALQAINVTDVRIAPGQYYLGLAIDNTTATVGAQTLTWLEQGRIGGLLEQTTAFALPATATFAQFTRLLNPGFGLTGNAVI